MINLFVNENARKFQGLFVGLVLVALGCIQLFDGKYPVFAIDMLLAIMCFAYSKKILSAVKYNLTWGILSVFCLVASPFWGMDGCSFIGALGMVLFFATAFDTWRRGVGQRKGCLHSSPEDVQYIQLCPDRQGC